MWRLALTILGGFWLIVLFRLLERRGIARPQGSVFGVPYDFRLPTVARLKARYWNPEDNRVLIPHAFGAGYSLNLGALARRLMGG